MVEIAPFVMVVLIVAIVSYSRLQRAKYHALGNDTAAGDGEAERLRTEIRQLNERIVVLERIVTDSDHNRSLALEREIEALRGPKE